MTPYEYLKSEYQAGRVAPLRLQSFFSVEHGYHRFFLSDDEQNPLDHKSFGNRNDGLAAASAIRSQVCIELFGLTHMPN